MKPRIYINKKIVLRWITVAILSILPFTACALEGDIAKEREYHRCGCTPVVPDSALAAELIRAQTDVQCDDNYIGEGL